jgi:acyl carrier protein
MKTSDRQSESQKDLQLVYDLLWRVRRREGLTPDRLSSFEDQNKKATSLSSISAVVELARSLGVEINDRQYDNTDEHGNVVEEKA